LTDVKLLCCTGYAYFVLCLHIPCPAVTFTKFWIHGMYDKYACMYYVCMCVYVPDDGV